MPSPGPIAPNLLEDFFLVSKTPRLVYTDFSRSVFPHIPLPLSTAHHSSIFNHIPHPYNPDASESLLLKHGLTPHYPLLPCNLRHGFPIRCMPALTNGVVLPNNPSTHAYMSDVQQYLQKELLAGRMSGPFSCEEAELILCGPFQASPLIVSLQPQQRGMPDKVRICRHLSKASKLHASVNSHICKEDSPTCFDLALKVAEIVSFYPSVPSPPSFLLSFYLPLFAPCAWGVFFSFHYTHRENLHFLCIILSLCSCTSCTRLCVEHILCFSFLWVSHDTRSSSWTLVLAYSCRHYHTSWYLFRHLMMFALRGLLSALPYLMVFALLLLYHLYAHSLHH